MKKRFFKSIAVLMAAVCCTVMIPKTANAAFNPGVHLHTWEYELHEDRYTLYDYHHFLVKSYYNSEGRWVEEYVECDIYRHEHIYNRTCTGCYISEEGARVELLEDMHSEADHDLHP